MASTGQTAWIKHFQPKFLNSDFIETVMKKESALYDEAGKSVYRIYEGNKIKVLKTESFQEKTPIQLLGVEAERFKDKTFYVTFNNIQKPKSSMAAGIKIKPQHFHYLSFNTPLTVNKLLADLIESFELRTDLDPTLLAYIEELTFYWAGESNSTQSISKLYSQLKEGKAEVAKDYGELLGALACIKRGILKKVNIPSDTRILLPASGTEPLADYYLIHNSFNNGKMTISAKSGTTTNTLKPKDVIELLSKQNKTNAWNQTPVYKLMKLVEENSVINLPFAAFNLVHGSNVVTQKMIDEAKKFRADSFNRTEYDHELFEPLMRVLGMKSDEIPTIGKLYFETEKYVIQKANTTEGFKPTKIFEAATSGAVTYVKYMITDSKPQGEFTVMASEVSTMDKKDIKWRSKNYAGRAADKIGLQP